MQEYETLKRLVVNSDIFSDFIRGTYGRKYSAIAALP